MLPALLQIVLLKPLAVLGEALASGVFTSAFRVLEAAAGLGSAMAASDIEAQAATFKMKNKRIFNLPIELLSVVSRKKVLPWVRI